MNIFAIILLALAAVSVTLLYLWVRRGRMAVLPGIGIFGGANIVIFFLFSLVQNNGVGQALLNSIMIGGLFTILAGMAAAYFRAAETRPKLEVGTPNTPQNAVVPPPTSDEYGEEWVNRKV